MTKESEARLTARMMGRLRGLPPRAWLAGGSGRRCSRPAIAVACTVLLIWRAWTSAQTRAVARARATDALIVAVLSGDTRAAERAITAGADVNAGSRGQLKTTGFRDTVIQIFRMGKRYRGTSLLNQARAHGNVAIVRILLEAGANPNNRGQDGDPPLVDAAATGDSASVRLLLDHGADIEAKSSEGDTSLHIALWNHHAKVANLLAERGADVKKKCVDGSSVLSRASRAGAVGVIEACLKAGENVNQPDAHGVTPLHLAASDGTPKTVRLLLDRGARPADVDPLGWTALLRACARGDVEAVKLLIDRGSDVTWTDRNSMGPVILAAAYGKERGGLEVLKELKRRGGDLNARDRDGQTALHLASAGDDSARVEWLLAQGLDVDARDRTGRTPLMAAVRDPSMEAVNKCFTLLSHGADANARDTTGDTPLSLAILLSNHPAGGYTDEYRRVLVGILLARGASPSHVNARGKSPLSLARQVPPYLIPGIAGAIEAAAAKEKRGDSRPISRTIKGRKSR